MHKFIKFSFNATINGLKAYQFLLVLTALLTMVVFILNTIQIRLPEPIQIIFDSFYKFQSLIYKPDLSIIPVDFTLVVFAIELLIMAGLVIYINYFVIEFERVYDKVHQDRCQRYEKDFNSSLAKEAKTIENKSKSFVLLYDIKIEKVVEQNFISLEENPVNVDTKIQEYYINFRNFILQNFKATYMKTSIGSLLYFEDINEADKLFDKIYEYSANTKETLKQLKLRFRLATAVCVADKSQSHELIAPKLKKLINIAVPNKVMALGDFKSKYKNLNTQKYITNSLGEYSLGAEILDVYTIEPNRQ